VVREPRSPWRQGEGPYIHGQQFVVRFTMDLTPKGGARTTVDEMGIYSVQGDEIVEERFFYGQEAVGL